MMSKMSIMGGVSLEAIVHGVTEDPREMGLLLGEGLGFFPWGIVDQHFLERGRFGRLIVAMSTCDEYFGFGVDENTAMFVEGDELHVLGESGVVVFDAREAFASNYGELGRDYCSLKMHFIDNGDRYNLATHTLLPGPDKELVEPSEISYTSPGHINRSVFGSNVFLEVMTRLAEGTDRYRSDKVTAYDREAELEVTLHLRRPRRSVSYSSLHGDSREYSCSGFELDLMCEAMSTEIYRAQQRERARYNAQRLLHGDGNRVNQSRLIATGSGLLSEKSAPLLSYLKEHKLYPVSIVAAASSEPRSATRDYMELFARHGIEAKDLQIRESNTLHQSQNEQLLQEISESPALLFLGGAQERLVDTLLYRGESTRVLHAIIRAYQRGAALIAVSGSASSLSEAMLAGGSTAEALCYGVSTDSWLQGVIVEPGFAFLRDAIIDQNLVGRNRLGRLLVACAEERERFGFGLLDHSGMSIQGELESIEALGTNGFVLLDLGEAETTCRRDWFAVERAEVRLVRPGQQVQWGEDEYDIGPAPEGSPAPTVSLSQLLDGLREEAASLNEEKGEERCKVVVHEFDEEAERAVLSVSMIRAIEGRVPIKELDGDI
jgi:cyanophycinase